jgi:hypothetical protein
MLPAPLPMRLRTLKLLGTAVAALCLAACGGGEIAGTVSGLGSGRSVKLLNNGSGTLDAEGTSIDTVRVTCSDSSNLRGTVSGLLAGVAVTLTDGSAQLAVAADGPFAFAEILSDGVAYSVSVQTQPSGQTCSVQNGAGSFIAASFVDIVVTCN